MSEYHAYLIVLWAGVILGPITFIYIVVQLVRRANRIIDKAGQLVAQRRDCQCHDHHHHH